MWIDAAASVGASSGTGDVKRSRFWSSAVTVATGVLWSPDALRRSVARAELRPVGYRVTFPIFPCPLFAYHTVLPASTASFRTSAGPVGIL